MSGKPDETDEKLPQPLEIVSEEERKELEGLPDFLQQTYLRMKSKSTEEQAKLVAEEIHNEIIPKGMPHPEQLKFAFAPFPTELTRTSPFFPMSFQEMKNREYIRDMVIAQHSWGQIKYRGPKLSTYDEDILMALLAILNETKNRYATEVDGELTYTYKGPLLPILKLKGTEQPGKDHYEQAIEAFKLMTSAAFELTVNKRTTRGKRATSKVFFTNLVSGGLWDPEKKELTVSVNPYFYQCFAAGNVTLIDVLIRASLKSPVAKSLYRFMQSHRDPRWVGHFLTLGAALNLDLEMRPSKIKERLNTAIKELIKENLLVKDSMIKDDIVTLNRVEEGKRLAASLQAAKKRIPHKK